MDVILLNLLGQVIIFIVLVYAVGYVLSLLNRLFYRITGGGRAVVYATGFIGTPIHELSHAAMCLVFFHRIDEIKLFQINDADGVLGYVNHSWNPKNIYQQIGNYFIGVAPVVVGTLVIYFLMKWMLPTSHLTLSVQFDVIGFLLSDGFSFEWFGYFFSMMGDVLGSLFSEITTAGIWWWLFMILALCIALHVTMSGADIKGSLVAIPLLIVILAIVNIVLGLLIPSAYVDFLGAMHVGGSFLIGLLFLSLVFSAMFVVIALIIRLPILLIFRK